MTRRKLALGEWLLIIVIALVPLFFKFPYRVNIFLSWEGAYRMSEGQLPFRDFGTPLGGMYWVVPALFFKLFGPTLMSLVKAQVLLNIIAGLSFRSILSSLQVKPAIRFVSVALFCLSYSFFNFWPWYNHSVIVYELAGLAFLFKYFSVADAGRHFYLIALAAFFIGCSFLTKQDGGGMAFGICCALLLYDGIQRRTWKPAALFIGTFVILIMILAMSFPAFHYWFNHGQPPHTARISLVDIADEFLSSSQWIKFYLLLIALLLFMRVRHWKEMWNNRNEMLFLLLTLFILGEAAIFQVTSYTPPDNNIFFHSFAVAFLLSELSAIQPQVFEKRGFVVCCSAGILIWWSGTYWKYIQRFVEPSTPTDQQTVSASGENVVNRKTYMLNNDTTDIPMGKWVETGLKSFKNVRVPQPTADGIHRLMNMDLLRTKKNLIVLNMSELTPLAAEIPFSLERNPQLPLWYHLGVGMFNQQAEVFEDRIRNHHYDLVLFEYVPGLNNFYPFRTRAVLRSNYRQVDSFMAPRRGDTQGTIEVFIKP